MDNITHTLIGLVAGDAIHHATNQRKMPTKARRSLFLLSSAIANSIPDTDIVLKSLLPAPLGSLLHHRGFTHTFIMAIPQALVVIGILFLFRRQLFSKQLTGQDWMLGFVTAIIGCCLHVFADGWNSYGVHPFYPFSNAWYYGDFIFIIEPVIWMIGGAWVILELHWLMKLFFFTLFSVVLAYGFSVQIIGYAHIAMLFFLLSFAIFSMRLLSISGRSSLAIILLTLALGFFKYQSHQAKAQVNETYRAQSLPVPEDIALSPSPTNPFCWTAIAATFEKENFVIRKSNLSLWPKKFPLMDCRFLNPGDQTYTTSLATFDSYKSDCHLKEWLRFARMPVIENGVAIDARFSRPGRNNFTTMKLEHNRKCLENVPPWEPSRQEIVHGFLAN